MEFTPEMKELLRPLFMRRMEQEKQEKLERFRRLNKFVRKGQIVFAGSSLMEQFPVNELLMDMGIQLTVYNRGVGGFTTAELAGALEPCVIDLAPKYLFINIGTNDLNGPDYTLSGLIERYEGILRTIREKLPKTNLYLLAYYPVNAEVGSRNPSMGQTFAYRTNARIQEANQAVEQLAQRMDAVYLDLNDAIADENGNMKAEFTIEGMHMYADGYMEILQRLLPVLQALS